MTMQPQQSPGLGRSVILADLILGGCIVAASLVLAFGGRRDPRAVSPLFRSSVERRVREQLRQAVGEGFAVGGAFRRTASVRVWGVRFLDDERRHLQVFYLLTMTPGARFYDNFILRKREGGYYETEHHVAQHSGGPVVRLRVR